MTKQYDRLAFLRHVAAVGLAAPTVSTLGCRLEEIARDDEDPPSFSPSITRPILLPWTDDAVRIAAPLSALPVAYISWGLMRIFIEWDDRLQVEAMLTAHISVSTGLWRIHLPGDDLEISIDAGDELRELVETPIGELDANMDPTEGDFRIRRGQRENVGVAFDCLPMAASEAWYSAGPWEIAQCTGRGPDLCRENFMDIGTGSRYARRVLGGCTEPLGSVRYLTWACPEL